MCRQIHRLWNSDTLNFPLLFLVFNLFQTVLLFSLTSFTFFNLNFYTLLVICFEFYIKRTGDVNSQIILTNKSFTYDKQKTKQETAWFWACFPYRIDSFWCKNPLYVYTVHLTLEIRLLLVQGTPDCQSQRNEPLFSQTISRPLPSQKHVFRVASDLKHEWRHAYFSCNACKITLNAPPRSAHALSCLQSKIGLMLHRSKWWFLVLADPQQAALSSM